MLLQRYTTEIIKSLKVERATLFLYDQKKHELISRFGTGLDASEIRISASTGIVGAVFSSEQTINIPDAYQDQRFNPKIDKQTGFKTQSILCVPLIGKDGKCIGAIQVLNKLNGTFTNGDEVQLKAFTTEVANAL